MNEQLILDLAQPEPATFANFVAGANREALAALAALASGASREAGLLLWGAHGAGKSHLLDACASAARIAMRPVVRCASPRVTQSDRTSRLRQAERSCWPEWPPAPTSPANDPA